MRSGKKGKYGLIDAQGKITLECEYDNLIRLKTGGFLILKEGKYGLASREGKLLILPKFDDMTDLDNGYVIASWKDKFGLMSNDGVSIIPMIYKELLYDTYNDLYLASEGEEWIEVPVP
ncbi:MAG: WG repeat-containing protein [Cyclobacteriaceae bacterium]|nr:WG repeat-containing protein [Cyclobacteriaceae bacterium]